MSDEFPPMIGKYKVLGIIAKGGMGVVYKAVHPSLKRYVVIKKMTARGHSTNAERFKKEAQILLDLQSPYIVHLFDYFTEGGFRYMVEELVDGEALDSLIKKEVSIPVPVAMLIMQDACFALKYAHSKSIVHRDIKPGNILISKRAEIKLADFGIATDANGDIVSKSSKKSKNAKKTVPAASDKTIVDSSLTQSGVALGTPAYMPPEQFEDSAGVDNRADIYALGIMLYEMITGTKPYSGEFSEENLRVIKKGHYIEPRSIDKSIPKSVSRLIRKMIKPKAKNRYRNIEAVLREVKKYLRHYDLHELRLLVARSVAAKKQFAFEKIEPKDKIVRIVRRCCAGLAAAAVVFGLCWHSGIIHKVLLDRWYSEVLFNVEMPRSLFNQMDLPMKITIFENDNDKIPEVPGSSRTFAVAGSRFSEKLAGFFKKSLVAKNASSKNEKYTMRPVYLKDGDYRAKIVVGPYVWWKSFKLDDGDFNYNCNFLKNVKRTLVIKPQAFDYDSQEDITSVSKFFINYKNSWTPVEEIDPFLLDSAAVWRIKVTADGYVPEIFSLLIDWYQDELILSAALKRELEGTKKASAK